MYIKNNPTNVTIPSNPGVLDTFSDISSGVSSDVVVTVSFIFISIIFVTINGQHSQHLRLL